ncbi:hypothetical protein G5B47_02195 [Paenibacillus sp. 7124]|uniref:Uncharacterized protein n=1 Tax=Paenibacillus apii TaxID=1850370 RepID=A0A6M1PFV4_9BACL|nr:hypothetical protein [Paenibacillus apii]NGM81218.1 hypothetical protein [Paenibacillus apii]
MSTDAYRAGYEAGYMYGWVDALKAAAYDDRTPLTKRNEDGEEAEPDDAA